MKTLQTIQIFLVLIGFSFSHHLFAQTSTAASQTNLSSMGQSNMMMQEHMKEMDTMAKSMASMAVMCRMMMEKEMRYYPLKIAAFSILGILGAAVLILFVVLEIQLIRFFSVRIKTERLKLK